jgi:hypothetical protein
LVGPSGSGKTTLLREIALQFDVSVVNTGLELSRSLLELTEKQRSLYLPELVNKIVSDANEPVILDNLEIIFDRSLKHEPLRLLQKASRNHWLLAAWNGAFFNSRLTYATADHPEYRSYESVEVVVVTTDGFSTLDVGNA